MPDSPVHVEFFGDAERMFSLPPELIIELERLTGMGIGSFCRNLFDGHFSYRHITETIRLALIGGGEAPEDASALIAAYVSHQPVMKSYPLAVSILEALMFGKANANEQ